MHPPPNRLSPLFSVWAPKSGPPAAVVAHRLPESDLHFSNVSPQSLSCTSLHFLSTAAASTTAGTESVGELRESSGARALPHCTMRCSAQSVTSFKSLKHSSALSHRNKSVFMERSLCKVIICGNAWKLHFWSVIIGNSAKVATHHLTNSCLIALQGIVWQLCEE